MPTIQEFLLRPRVMALLNIQVENEKTKVHQAFCLGVQLPHDSLRKGWLQTLRELVVSIETAGEGLARKKPESLLSGFVFDCVEVTNQFRASSRGLLS